MEHYICDNDDCSAVWSVNFDTGHVPLIDPTYVVLLVAVNTIAWIWHWRKYNEMVYCNINGFFLGLCYMESWWI